jgi:hypothetical protein
MKRRKLLTSSAGIGTIAFIGTPISAWSQITNSNDAINKAGRQRMLNQRMAKCYLALGLGVLPDESEKLLASSIALYDRTVIELLSFAPNPAIKETYQLLNAKWNEYKILLIGSKPAKQNAAALLAVSDSLLGLGNQGVTQFEQLINKPISRLVNLSGRQRMLSQRMAKAYLAASWGVQVEPSKAELAAALDEFVTAQNLLTKATENTPRITQELELATQQFAFYRSSLQNLRPGAGDKTHTTIVIQTSDRITQVMDGVTTLYTRIS